MADILLPPWLKIARTQFAYLDNTGLTRALYTKIPETTGYGGDRMRASLEFAPAGGISAQGKLERAVLRAFLTRLRGRQNRAFLFDPGYQRRGSFPTGELLGNATFVNGTTGFSLSDATLSLAENDRVARLTQISTGSTTLVSAASVPTTAQAAYALRAAWNFGRIAGTAGTTTLRAGSTSGANDYGESSSFTTGGVSTFMAVVTGSSAFPGFRWVHTSAQLSDYVDIQYFSMSRCLQSSSTGSGVAGTAIYVSRGPASTTRSLLPDDRVEIITSLGSELKVVTASLDFDSSGLGYLQFLPPLRGTVTTSSPVIVHQPMGRFMFGGEFVGWNDEPGVFTRASADFEEW